MKGQTAIFEEMIEDEDGLMDDRLPTTSRGLWAASETERSLKAVLSFAKVKRMDPELVEEGNAFMELFENWKKEYKVSIRACKRNLFSKSRSALVVAHSVSRWCNDHWYLPTITLLVLTVKRKCLSVE